jgi:hypothetical protein
MAALGYDDRDALYGKLQEHHLRIGDAQFYVPPTAIQVTRRMKNDKVNILRGRGSFVKSSGYFDLVIDINLFFPDMQSINNELRPLLAQCRKCPFLPISNTLLNNVYKIEAVTIAGITVQTIPGFPHSLQATLQLYAFNPYTYIYDQSERSFEEMFNWPLFRWYYQRNLKPDPKRTLVYYEPLQNELNNQYMFKIADESDLIYMKNWRLKRDELIMKWLDDKNDKRFLDEEDYNWIGPIPIPKSGTQAGSNWNDETDEKLFNEELDALYKDDPGKVLNEYDIHMDNWDIPGLILEELSASYENVITSVQLQAHESPTHQYLGSQDVVFVARFKTDDQEALGSLENLVRRSTYLVRNYHQYVSNGFISFDHQLTRLFGANYVIIEDMVSNTVEGQPGMYEITLTMTSYNRAQRRLAETHWLSDQLKWDLPNKAFYNIFQWPLFNQDPLGGFLDMDVRKKAVYDTKVKQTFKAVEVYPDLELPTYKEVEEAGFKIPNLNDGEFVDPDFFLIYDDPIDFAEEMNTILQESIASEMRDYMNGKATVVGGKMTPDENVQKQMDAEKAKRAQSAVYKQGPDETSEENLPADEVEALIRKKAQEVGLDQTLAVALAKSFDADLRQFYTPGQGKNKNLGNVEVNDKNIPIMVTKDGRFFTDTNFVRDAMYIGVMRVSPLFGDAHALAFNIEYNVEQGCAALQYYLNLVQSDNLVNDNVYNALGLSGYWQDDVKKAQWAAAVAMYLGFEREWRLLVNDNKKLPYNLIAQIKKILNTTQSLSNWDENQINQKYSQLKIPDYKTISMQSATSHFQEEDHQEKDFEDHELTFREMWHDTCKYDRRGRLVRAFPTFFLVFIDEGQFLGAVKMSDQFFGYRAVSDITFTNSRKNASSTLALEMCNVFGTLTDAIKGVDLTHTSIGDLLLSILAPNLGAQEIERSRHRDPNWYQSIYLRTGARVHFRMGYGSNPMNMPTIINGTITQLTNNGETVSVIVQDDGIELTNKLKASPKDTTRGFLFSSKEPSHIIDELLTDEQGFFKNVLKMVSNADYQKHSLGIMHFGAPGEPIDYFFRNDFQTRPVNEITMNIYDTTGFMRDEQNGLWARLGNFFGIGQHDEDGININLYDKSVWDVLTICAAVGPDMLVAVHPFDFRNTIFLGKPYFPIVYGYEAEDEKNIKMLVKPFRQFHVYDSWTSIVDNSIQATTENMYTVAVGVYHNEGNIDTTEPIYADTNIWPELQRTVMIDTQLNVQGVRLIQNLPLVGDILNKPAKWYFDEWTAIKIAAAGLRDYVKEMYDGYLTVMGDPSVKPYDQFFMHDSFIDMTGPAEVREVNHIMNFEVGYLTLIKPDCVVVNSDQTAMSFLQSMGTFAVHMIAVYGVRNMLRNSGYKGAYPIMNAAWASVKRRFEALKGKFDTSRMSNLIKEMDPITGKVREYASVTKETLQRWAKSGLLKEFVKNLGHFTMQDAENLFDKASDALSNRFKIDYTKIAKLRGSMSKIMYGGSKVLGQFTKYGLAGAELLAGPPGWLALLIETAVIEIITSCIAEFIERWLFTRKAVIIAPLKKEGIEFSAGINGHQGSVVGDSPDVWQRLLTGPLAPFLLGLLGSDTSKYKAPTNFNDNSPDLFKTKDVSNSGDTFDLNTIASNFFNTYRKKVYYDQNIVDRYNQDKIDAQKEMDGHKQELDKEEEQKRVKYPEKKHFNFTLDWFFNLFKQFFDQLNGGSSGATGTSFDDIDLNIPSGISAEAIDAAFAKYGPALQGLGKYFKQVEYGIPPAPSPLDAGGGGGRVMNGLYLAAHAAWETGWGKSRIFKDKNNLFGYGAYDSSPYESAYRFASPKDCIFYAANKIKDNYLTPGGPYYAGPTLKGMNKHYATDPNWHKGIADIMAMIAKFDPNFQWPGSSTGHAQVTGEVPDTFGAAGKKKYHLETNADAAKYCVDLDQVTLKNVKKIKDVDTKYLRKASLEMIEALGKAYKDAVGDTLVITSAFRESDPDWHGTGFAVDVDTPDCQVIAGAYRFPKGSKDKANLKTLMELAIQVGFDGLIHGDVDVVAELKQKYPNKLIMQMNDHYNHLHLSYPTK